MQPLIKRVVRELGQFHTSRPISSVERGTILGLEPCLFHLVLLPVTTNTNPSQHPVCYLTHIKPQPTPVFDPTFEPEAKTPLHFPESDFLAQKSGAFISAKDAAQP